MWPNQVSVWLRSSRRPGLVLVVDHQAWRDLLAAVREGRLS